MPTELQTAIVEMKTTWEEMKGAVTEAQKEIKSYGEHTGETKQLLERLNARIDEMEVKSQRLARESASEQKNELTADREAFIAGLRYGVNRLKPEIKSRVRMAQASEIENIETKALSLTDDTLGGYLAVPEFVNDIIKASLVFSPIRSYANVRKTSNRSVQVPVRTGQFAAQWVSETGQRSETTGLKYGRKELSTWEMYAEVLISNQDLEDSAFDMDQQIQMEAAEQFGIAEGAAFVNGTGVGQPEGFMTSSAVPSVNMGSATVVTYAGLVNALHALKSPYVPNARWTMKRATVGLIRGLLDTNNRPLWDIGTPGVSAGLVNPNPPTILGLPYFESPDMPTLGSGTKPIALGDFNRAFTIVDRVTMVVQRLIEKYAESGQTAYIVRKRVGAQIVLGEALLKVNMA